MNALHYRFWNAQGVVSTFAASAVVPEYQDSGLALEQLPHNIRAEIPRLRDLGHAVMAFLKAGVRTFPRAVAVQVE